jgi:hypothetical protein
LNKLLYSTSDLKITVKEIQFSIRFIHKLQPLIYIYIFFFCVTAPAVAFKAAEGSMHGALSDQKQHSEKDQMSSVRGRKGRSPPFLDYSIFAKGSIKYNAKR